MDPIGRALVVTITITRGGAQVNRANPVEEMHGNPELPHTTTE